MREVTDVDVADVASGRAGVAKPYRSVYAYRLLALGWDHARVAAQLSVSVETVLLAKRTADNAVFYARAERLAGRARSVA
ncbi:hypothetical protein ACFRAO_23645 [Streptomyces sp. NPDC056656]|uniref:hypothetical protein n=1 Tax=Streptomyces sp. NPDC056656 TaxID=3345895 RepID=UPI0036840680